MKKIFRTFLAGICVAASVCALAACDLEPTTPPSGETPSGETSSGQTQTTVTKAQWESALSHETFKNVTINFVGSDGVENAVGALGVVHIADNKVEADMQVSTFNMHFFYEYIENGVTYYQKDGTGNWEKNSKSELTWEYLMETGTSGSIPFYNQLMEHYQKFTYSEGVYTTQESITFTAVIGGNTSCTLQDIAVKFSNGKAIEISYTMSVRGTDATYSYTMSDYGTTQVVLPTVGSTEVVPPSYGETQTTVTKAQWESALSHETFKNVTINCVPEGFKNDALGMARVADNKLEMEMPGNLNVYYEFIDDNLAYGYGEREDGKWEKHDMSGMTLEYIMSTGIECLVPFYTQLAEHYQKFTYSEGVYTTQESITFTTVIGGNTSYTLQNVAVKFSNGKAIEISYTVSGGTATLVTYTMSNYGTTEVVLPTVAE